MIRIAIIISMFFCINVLPKSKAFKEKVYRDGIDTTGAILVKVNPDTSIVFLNDRNYRILYD